MVNLDMTKIRTYILLLLFGFTVLVQSQTINFNCDFDGTLTGDCKFTNVATGPSMTSDQGAFSPSANPKQPYSDAKAVRSPTQPNDEPCVFPYPFPTGGWDMYFCRRFTNGTATCPTASGSGRCNAGKYGLVKLPASGASDFTYFANVLRSSSTRQCLDFYYYITDTTGNARMEFQWETDDDLDAIVEVTAVDNQNKWQHRRVSFDVTAGITAYKLMMRVRRDATQANFVFALDEVQIIDAECDSSGTTPITTTTTIAVTTTAEPTTTTAATTTIPWTGEPATTVTPETTTTTTTTTTTVTSTTTTAPATTEAATTTTTTTTTAAVATATGEQITIMTTTTTTTATTTTTTTTTMTPTTTTTTDSSRPFFVCNFSEENCFPNSPLIITNGTEVPLLNITEPPRAPLSDASSVIKPTSNNETCSLPYQLPFENSTVGWDMWFCYDNECPTQSDQQQSGVCASGNYGLTFVDPAETNKTMSTVVGTIAETRSASEEHCLLYSYYMTVYDGADWGQQLSVWTRADDSADDVEVDRVQVSDMRENRWYTRRKTITAPVASYTLTLLFEGGADASLRTKTVYFAVDNIELYNRRCEDDLTTATSSASTPTMSVSMTPMPNGTETTKKPENLGLILGLSLGIGIPALLIIVGGLVYYCVVKRPRSKIQVEGTIDDTDIPMVPTRTNSANKTLGAVVM